MVSEYRVFSDLGTILEKLNEEPSHSYRKLQGEQRNTKITPHPKRSIQFQNVGKENTIARCGSFDVLL